MRRASLTLESFKLNNDTAITVELSPTDTRENFSPERTFTEILEMSELTHVDNYIRICSKMGSKREAKFEKSNLGHRHPTRRGHI